MMEICGTLLAREWVHTIRLVRHEPESICVQALPNSDKAAFRVMLRTLTPL